MPIRLSSEEIQKRLLEHQIIYGRYKRLGKLLGDMRTTRDAKIEKLEAKIRELKKEISHHYKKVEEIHDNYAIAENLYDAVETGDMEKIADRILDITGRNVGFDFEKLITYLDNNSVVILPDNINAESELEEFVEEFQRKYPMTKIYKDA